MEDEVTITIILFYFKLITFCVSKENNPIIRKGFILKEESKYPLSSKTILSFSE